MQGGRNSKCTRLQVGAYLECLKEKGEKGWGKGKRNRR